MPWSSRHRNSEREKWALRSPTPALVLAAFGEQKYPLSPLLFDFLGLEEGVGDGVESLEPGASEVGVELMGLLEVLIPANREHPVLSRVWTE